MDERARLEAELRSFHADGLTGAFRGEVGRAALAAEIERARRANGRLVVAFVDVDRLREVNDRAGRATGDEVLETVGQTLRAKLGSSDPIVRYGGDEFVCALGATDLPAAEAHFEAIRAAVEAAAGVGVSVGFATLSETDNVDDLIHRAERMLLERKAAEGSRHG
jgi:diguanylate cyclase (GGDEF)-like protein